MPVFYEFKLQATDREDFERSKDLCDLGIKSDPQWVDIDCVINLDKIESFHEDIPGKIKIFLSSNDSMILSCNYEDLKEILRKHYGVYPEK
jgi:hypothetical protein